MTLLHRFLPKGRRPFTVRTGLLKGLRLNLDLRRGDGQLGLGLYERETFPWIRRLLAGCRGAIDIGAAQGELTVFFLRQPRIERVVAVEPAEAPLALFKANLQTNRLAEDTRLWLHAGYAGRGTSPEWRTLDDLAAAVPGPLFIKIDVDGPEAELLASGREVLARRDCRLLIETHSPTAESECRELLRTHGYIVQLIPNAWWRCLIPEHRVVPHNRWLAAWRPSNHRHP